MAFSPSNERAEPAAQRTEGGQCPFCRCLSKSIKKSHLHQNTLPDMLQFYFSPFISFHPPAPPHSPIVLAASCAVERAERAARVKETGEKEKSFKLREKPESLLVPLQQEL